jgi:hypothetical protein
VGGIGTKEKTMKRFLLLLLPILILAIAPVSPAQAAVCLDRSRMLDTLITEYGEQLAEVREIKGTGILEFHVSKSDGTWTALLTDYEQWSCVLATGEGLVPPGIITISERRI